MNPTTIIATPLGNLALTFTNHKLTHLTLLKDSAPSLPSNEPYIMKAVASLQRYFQNPNHKLEIDLDPQVTPFQHRVLTALQTIPTGTTLTYGELAKHLKTSPRAIGQACRKNPIPIIIPCHRVVAMNGAGGYAGEREGRMLDIKHWLLKHENADHYTT